LMSCTFKFFCSRGYQSAKLNQKSPLVMIL
jgi:hypothetical protein